MFECVECETRYDSGEDVEDFLRENDEYSSVLELEKLGFSNFYLCNKYLCVYCFMDDIDYYKEKIKGKCEKCNTKDKINEKIDNLSNLYNFKIYSEDEERFLDFLIEIERIILKK